LGDAVARLFAKNCGPIGLLTQLPRQNLLRQKAYHPADVEMHPPERVL
jgi:hypothetical protein